MIRLYIPAAAFLAGVLLAGPGGWKLKAWQGAAIERDRIAAEAQALRDQSKRIDRAAETYLTQGAKAKAKAEVIDREVIRYVQNPANSAVCIDPDGLRILQDLAAVEQARRQPSPALRGASRPD